jgi:hypothetical protein
LTSPLPSDLDLKADVADPVAVEALVAAVAGGMGPIDIAVRRHSVATGGDYQVISCHPVYMEIYPIRDSA